MSKTEVVNIKAGDTFDVFIGRPSRFGNRYRIGPDGTREEVIEKHQKATLANSGFVTLIKRELTGKRLGCYCKPLPCHGDIYVMICEGK